MNDDPELLRRYAETGSEAAFAELVQRHLPLVYSVALRKVGGDAHLAQDVAQRVFTELARKAARLTDRATLAGWLFTSTRFAASQTVRTERRRRAREKTAELMNEPDPDAGIAWERLRPLLDDLLGELDDADRDAVLLRYFQQRSYAEIGARLRLSEDGARSRVDRAVEKLRTMLTRAGVTSTTAAVATALGAQITATAPSGLAAAIARAAVAKPALLAVLTKPLVATLGIALLGGGWLWRGQAHTSALGREIAALEARRDELGRERAESTRLRALAQEVEALRADDAELARLRDELAAARPLFEPRSQPMQNSGVAIITGYVRTPGRLPMPAFGGLALGELLRRAGGLDETAAAARVRITRRKPDGSLQTFVKDADKEGDFVAQQDDVIYVPQRIN